MKAVMSRKGELQPDFQTVKFMLGPERIYEYAHSVGMTDPDLRAVAPPIPPVDLRKVTAANEEPIFLWTGAVDIQNFLTIFSSYSSVDRPAVLDFGCGCGRLSRYFEGSDAYQVSATDINPDLVNWCKTNLCRIDTKLNGIRPPAPFPENKFDLIYTLSIFTHLPHTLTEEWLADFGRMLKPGGILIATTHGQHAIDIIRSSKAHQTMFVLSQENIEAINSRLPDEKHIFVSYAQPVIEYAKAGPEYGNSFMHPEYAAQHWNRTPWKLLEHRPGGLRYWQDIYVLQKSI